MFFWIQRKGDNQCLVLIGLVIEVGLLIKRGQGKSNYSFSNQNLVFGVSCLDLVHFVWSLASGDCRLFKMLQQHCE